MLPYVGGSVREVYWQLSPQLKGKGLMWIFLMLVGVPIIEIALFIEVGGWIGLWPTIAIVILTALLGTALLRQQGFAALADLQGRLAEGRDPRSALAHGAMILVAGIVLLTPGFFTDAIGFLLLVPPVRDAVIRYVGAKVDVRMAGAATRTGDPRADQATINTDYVDVTPTEPQEQDTPGDSGWTKGSDEAKPPR